MNTNPTARITVLLADDHTLVRQGIRKLLEAEGDIQIVGEAGSGRDAVALTTKHRPSVVVMDIAMPRFNGLEATRQIRETVPDAKVLILSAHAQDAYVEAVMAMGAVGYLLKQTSARCLAEGIRQVSKGNTYFAPDIAKRYGKRHVTVLDRKGRSKTKGVNLTAREMVVLQQIAEGAANKQIAAELGISIKTVEKHRDHLMRKLDIHDTASLTRYAIEAGIIECFIEVPIVFVREKRLVEAQRSRRKALPQAIEVKVKQCEKWGRLHEPAPRPASQRAAPWACSRGDGRMKNMECAK